MRCQVSAGTMAMIAITPRTANSATWTAGSRDPVAPGRSQHRRKPRPNQPVARPGGDKTQARRTDGAERDQLPQHAGPRLRPEPPQDHLDQTDHPEPVRVGPGRQARLDPES